MSLDINNLNLNELLSEWNKYENKIDNYNNRINTLKQEVSQLKEVQDNIFDNIKHYTYNHNISNKILGYNGYKYKVCTTNTYQPLSFKYIHNILNNIVNNDEYVKLIINSLKKNRDVKSISYLKRY